MTLKTRKSQHKYTWKDRQVKKNVKLNANSSSDIESYGKADHFAFAGTRLRVVLVGGCEAGTLFGTLRFRVAGSGGGGAEEEEEGRG